MPASISLEGSLSNDVSSVGIKSLKNLFELLINDFQTYPTHYYSISPNELKSQMNEVKWKIASTPIFNAFVRPKTNEIGVNLFSILSIMSIPKITDFIQALITNNKTINLSQLDKIIKNIPVSISSEVGELFKTWQNVDNSSLRKNVWNINEFSKVSNFFFFENMMRFLIWHETSHWNFERFNIEYKDNIIGQTFSHLNNFLKEGNFIDENSIYIAYDYLSDEEVCYHWSNEISADTMSALGCIQMCKNSEERMNFYASLAIMFGLLTYYQDYLINFRNIDLSFRTHPPVAFRQEILLYNLSKEHQMNLKDFITYEYGTGVAVNMIMRQILDNYRQLKQKI